MRAGADSRATRDRQIFERHSAGATFATLSVEFGLSAARIRQIAIRGQFEAKRSFELFGTAQIPQQPNILHLSPRLRHALQKHFGRKNITPLDILATGFPKDGMYRIANLRRKGWLELVEWMEQAGFSAEP